MIPANVLPVKKGNRPGWKTIISLTLAILLIRFIFIWFMGLMPQDAYYDFYAQHPALSYYDHPPMIAYLLRIFTGLFGKKAFVLKLADSIVTWGTVLAFYHLAKKFLSPHRRWYGMLLLLSTFMITVLSLVSTPDVPLMLCWTISLIFLHTAIFQGRKMYWIWAGIMTGLTFDSKYTAIFLLIGIAGFLLISKQYRKNLFSCWFLLYLICTGIVILPVIIWNVNHGFASFKFQSEARLHSMEGIRFSLLNFGGVLGHQSAVLMPFLFFSLFYFLYRLIRKCGWKFGRIPDDQLFLLSFFVPLFLGFLFISPFYWVKINWIMPAYISGILWVCRYWNKKWIRIQIIFSFILHVVLAAEVIFYIVPVQSDDTWFGWKDFSRQVKTLRASYPDAFIFSTDDYKTSAILNFYLDEMVYAKNVVGERALQFDFIGTDLQHLNGKNAIYIDSDPQFPNMEKEGGKIPVSYYRYFDRIVSLDPILIRKNSRVERKFFVFLCLNYHIRASSSH